MRFLVRQIRHMVVRLKARTNEKRRMKRTYKVEDSTLSLSAEAQDPECDATSNSSAENAWPLAPPTLLSCRGFKSHHRRSSRRINSSLTAALLQRETKVRFDESRNDDSLCSANSEFRAESWYNLQDLMIFRSNSLMLSRQVANIKTREEYNFRRLLDNVYRACQDETKNGLAESQVEGKSYSNANNSLRRSIRQSCFARRSLQSKAQRLELQLALQERYHLVGMERSVVPDISKDLQERRCLAWETVQDIQKQVTHSSLSSMREKMIRQSMEQLSRPSRLFAREIARANFASD